MNYKHFIGKFIGPNKIVGMGSVGRWTYLKREVVEAEYENGNKEEFPEVVFNRIVTDEATDLTTLRDMYVKPVIEEVITILLEAEVSIADIEQILARTSLSLNDNLERANAILWGKDLMKRTVADIHKILLQANEQQRKPAKSDDGPKRKRGKPGNEAKE